MNQTEEKKLLLEDNDIINDSELDFSENYDNINFDELEEKLEHELNNQFSEFAFLEEERNKIQNPDSLGKVVYDQVMDEVGKQLGLDMTNETLIQEYDRKNPDPYSVVGDKVMSDKRYRSNHKEMMEKLSEGELIDAYTGEKLKPNESVNLDHVVPRKEIFENQRRKQAKLSVADLANKKENLQATNENLNKSKNQKSVDKYVQQREQREKDLQKNYENTLKKIDAKNESDLDKQIEKNKAKKSLDNKLAAKDELMQKADKTARKAINKDIRVEATKQVGKKAGKDALKVLVTSLVMNLIKNIIKQFVNFIKDKAKSFKNFLVHMKEAIMDFFKNLLNSLQQGASAFLATIVSEIFGPIVSLFRKLSSLIKQGINSFVDAIKFLCDKNNKNLPFYQKAAAVGKIITGAIVTGGAIFLGEVFEKLLLGIPVFAIEIPLLGSLANIIGLVLSSLICGIIGAIVINLIDKFVATKQKAEINEQRINCAIEIIGKQEQLKEVKIKKVYSQMGTTSSNIQDRHTNAVEIMRQALEENKHSDAREKNKITDNEINELNNLFSKL